MSPTRQIVLLAAAALAGGCVYQDIHLEEGERTETVEHVIDSGLVVATKNGSVNVRQGDVPDVEIVARIKAHNIDRIDAFRIDARHEADGNLHISALWPDGRRLRNESCGFDITIPDANGVTITTDNGAILISGLAGDAELNTDNGSVDVTDHAGAVNAETDNGRISVRNSPGPVGATTDNGRVELLDVGTPITAETDNGSVTIRLADGAPGPVRAITDNGSVTLLVGDAFAGALDITTDNGGISVTNIRGANVTHASKHHMHLTVGEAEHSSSIKTDNGGITVKGG